MIRIVPYPVRNCDGDMVFFVGQTGQIVHAGVQRQGNFFQLFKGVISFSGFQFGIIALVNAGEHLHFDLGIAAFFSQFS